MYLCTEITFVSKYVAVMINLLDIFEVIDVMHTSLGQFIRMYNVTQTAKCMKLISKEVDALRCTISEVRCFCIITISSHLTTFTTGYAAHFYRLVSLYDSLAYQYILFYQWSHIERAEKNHKEG